MFIIIFIYIKERKAVVTRTSQTITKHTQHRSILLMLCHAYIFPYMTYCIEVWRCASQTQLNCLLLLQKKIIRKVSFSHYLAHTNPLFLSMEVLPLRKYFFMTLD